MTTDNRLREAVIADEIETGLRDGLHPVDLAERCGITIEELLFRVSQAQGIKGVLRLYDNASAAYARDPGARLLPPLPAALQSI